MNPITRADDENGKLGSGVANSDEAPNAVSQPVHPLRTDSPESIGPVHSVSRHENQVIYLSARDESPVAVSGRIEIIAAALTWRPVELQRLAPGYTVERSH